MGLYLNSLLSTTIFFFALPLGEMCMHFRVFRSASAPFPLLSEECMCILECRAGRRAERQGFFNRKIPDFKMHMHSERRTTPFPLRQCHHNSTMRRHECSCDANVIITGWSELHF